MLSYTLLVGGLTVYAAQLLTMPIVFPMYLALGTSVVAAVNWALHGSVSIFVPPAFMCLFALAVLINVYRLRVMSHTAIRQSQRSPPDAKPSACQLYTLIVLGSGGHTKEMLYMMSRGFIPSPRAHRRYLISSGDRLSLVHLKEWEAVQEKAAASCLDNVTGRKGPPAGTFDVVTVPRARHIHQSLLSTPFTAAASIAMLVPALLKRPAARPDLGPPDLIISNGPATGFFTVLTAFSLRALALVPEEKMRSLYVESWARISTLSVTGRLFQLTGIADRAVVQHEKLSQKYGMENGGWLVLAKDGGKMS
ncbi:UDP-N-acetylglucosamine transferase subunit [Ceratocystis pirilliformis]|uniref:UDP-N-acetylglucosamine transferase subunit ALG14 n=1 Tax=Ceratocystis pirilliformis TaxID=259994 RepID=A0ABR3ZDA3_9PEZI